MSAQTKEMPQILTVAENLSLPAEFVTQTCAILAKRGVGKTYTALVLVEEMLKAGLHVVCGDPIGVMWGLRASADGKSPGLPIVVLGGDHGDAPLEVGAGATVADLVIEDGLSVVLDLSVFRKGDQTRFMTDFAERLYHKNRAPLHLVLDEADAFAPQRPMPGEQRLLGAIEDLVRRGRARGIGVTLVSQRAAVLNKNVLTQVEMLVAMRTIAPQDRDAVDEWVKVHGTPEQRAELMESLPSLPIGTAWFWSPGWLDVFKRVKVRRRDTFDSSATPKIGAVKHEPKTLAPVDLERLKARIAATIERAKAEDPRELRRRIAALEQDLRKARTAEPAPDAAVIERARQEGYASGYAKAREGMLRIADELFHIGAGLSSARIGLQNLAEDSKPGRPAPSIKIDSRPPHSVPAKQIRTELRAVERRDMGKSGLRRMLIALAQRPGLSARQLGLRAGLSSSSGTFQTYLGRARSEGWVSGSRERLEITAAGLEALGKYDPLPEGRELLAYWVGELGNSGAARMLEALADVYPKALRAEELGERAGLSSGSGTFQTYLGRLRTLELVSGGRSDLRASEELFA